MVVEATGGRADRAELAECWAVTDEYKSPAGPGHGDIQTSKVLKPQAVLG